MKQRHHRVWWHAIYVAVRDFFADHVPEAYSNRPCPFCSYAIDGRMMWTVHEPGRECPRKLEKWCLDCNRWSVLDRHLRTGCCQSLNWHPSMSKPPVPERTESIKLVPVPREGGRSS